MTRIKRCISVIVLAAFSIILLAGCNDNWYEGLDGYCDDISNSTKTNYNLTNFSIMADGSTMQTRLWALAKCYETDIARSYNDDKIESAETDLKQIATLYSSSTNLSSGNYYCVLKEWTVWGGTKAPLENLINLLTAINTWAGENNAIISFKAYEASGDYLFYRDYTFVVGFTVVIIDDDDDDDEADEPTSSECTSGCKCNGDTCSCDNCSCNSDTYSPCICGS